MCLEPMFDYLIKGDGKYQSKSKRPKNHQTKSMMSESKTRSSHSKHPFTQYMIDGITCGNSL